MRMWLAPGVCAAGLHGIAGLAELSAHLIAPAIVEPIHADDLSCSLPSVLKYGLCPAQIMSVYVLTSTFACSALLFLHLVCFVYSSAWSKSAFDGQLKDLLVSRLHLFL